MVIRDPLTRSGAFVCLPLIPWHARQPCHAENRDLVAEKLLRKSGKLVPTDRGADGVEQGAQSIDLAHIRADAELQSQGVAVCEPVQLKLRKLSLALAGRQRGPQCKRQANYARPKTPPNIARSGSIRIGREPKQTSKLAHQNSFLASPANHLWRCRSFESTCRQTECISFNAAVKVHLFSSRASTLSDRMRPAASSIDRARTRPNRRRDAT